MKLKPFIFLFALIWLLSAGLTYWCGDLVKAANFGESFGAINSLLSGIALAMAIYSMILQQKQSAIFEKKTLAAMTHQAETLEIMKTNLIHQSNVARVTALTHLIAREEQRIETLRDWGQQAYKDENYYAKGIKAAQARIDDYHKQILKVGTAV